MRVITDSYVGDWEKIFFPWHFIFHGFNSCNLQLCRIVLFAFRQKHLIFKKEKKKKKEKVEAFKALIVVREKWL